MKTVDRQFEALCGFLLLAQSSDVLSYDRLICLPIRIDLCAPLIILIFFNVYVFRVSGQQTVIGMQPIPYLEVSKLICLILFLCGINKCFCCWSYLKFSFFNALFHEQKLFEGIKKKSPRLWKHYLRQSECLGT